MVKLPVTHGWKWHLVRMKVHFNFLTEMNLNKYSFPRSGKGSIIEVPLLLLTSLRTHFFISKKRFLVLFPIKPMVAHHDFCCQALLAIMGIILPKKIYCKLLHCPANPDINPLLPWPAHIAILPLFNLFFFWGVGIKSLHVFVC